MSNLKLFAPYFYWHGSLLESHVKQIDRIFKRFIDNENNFKLDPGWDCTLKTSFKTKQSMEFLGWNTFNEIMIDHIKSFLNDTESNILPVNYWCNKYEPGDSQEIHTHVGEKSNISLVYFHTVSEENNCDFVFYDREYRDSHFASGFMEDELPKSENCRPKVKSGDFIVFPSHYPHYVTTHKGIGTRITFSANYTTQNLMFSSF